MWQLFLAPLPFIVISVSRTTGFSFWHPSKMRAHHLCILRIHWPQSNRYLYNHKHGSCDWLRTVISSWPACILRSPPSKNFQRWAAPWTYVTPWMTGLGACSPTPSIAAGATTSKKPRVQIDRTSEPSKTLIMSAHAQKAVWLQTFLRSCRRMFAGNSAKLHPPAARRLQQQSSRRAEMSTHPCTNGSVDCQSFCIHHSFHVIMFPFSVVASDQWCV